MAIIGVGGGAPEGGREVLVELLIICWEQTDKLLVST